MTTRLTIPSLLIVYWIPLATCWAAEPSAKDLLRDALVKIQQQDGNAAIVLLTKAIEADPKLAEAYRRRGQERFKLNQISESIADFDQFAELAPDHERELWERGICHYYAGRYDDGAKQFASYQEFQDNDVENAVWRFICMARGAGVEKARKEILPIKRDPRVPLMEVYALFQGKAKPEAVLAAAKAGSPKEDELKDRLFFAHLYLGLYHEATGDADKAKEHMVTAAEKYKADHYMWHVANVHATRMRKAEKK